MNTESAPLMTNRSFRDGLEALYKPTIIYLWPDCWFIYQRCVHPGQMVRSFTQACRLAGKWMKEQDIGP